jgi:thiol-disulfide isomerase/thioredoxin
LKLFAVLALAFLSGCSEPERSAHKNSYVGDLSDHSYAGQIRPTSKKYRVNAEGDSIAIDRYAGKFVWANLAAPWCPPCVTQTQAISALERRYPQRVVFLTIITSEDPGKMQAPRPQAARDWANRFKLKPANVLVAIDLFGRTVPAHYLYSPTGQTLYHHIGGLSQSQISAVLDRHLSTWVEAQQ